MYITSNRGVTVHFLQNSVPWDTGQQTHLGQQHRGTVLRPHFLKETTSISMKEWLNCFSSFFPQHWETTESSCTAPCPQSSPSPSLTCSCLTRASTPAPSSPCRSALRELLSPCWVGHRNTTGHEVWHCHLHLLRKWSSPSSGWAEISVFRAHFLRENGAMLLSFGNIWILFFL